MTLWLQVTAGQGPAECQWVVAQVVETILREAGQAGLGCVVLDNEPGERAGTLKSALLLVVGDTADRFAGTWCGTIQWVGRSPYRPHHKRKNWFVGVESFVPTEQPPWSESEVRLETMRSSGPGGQHVNKTSSAVRATHLPSGLTAIAREERSQHQNRRLALARLASLLNGRGAAAEDSARQKRWQEHAELERGNPIRVYEGAVFRRRRPHGQ